MLHIPDTSRSGSGALASIIFGIALLVAPGAGALALIWLIGAYAIVFGVLLIALAVRLHGLGHGHPVRATA